MFPILHFDRRISPDKLPTGHVACMPLLAFWDAGRNPFETLLRRISFVYRRSLLKCRTECSFSAPVKSWPSLFGCFATLLTVVISGPTTIMTRLPSTNSTSKIGVYYPADLTACRCEIGGGPADHGWPKQSDRDWHGRAKSSFQKTSSAASATKWSVPRTS
jgi:hypothetical protein